MAGCGFCESATGPFTTVEGLFWVRMCARCQRGECALASPYPALSPRNCAWALSSCPPGCCANAEGGCQPAEDC
jgi:hypothetical protein